MSFHSKPRLCVVQFLTDRLASGGSLASSWSPHRRTVETHRRWPLADRLGVPARSISSGATRGVASGAGSGAGESISGRTDRVKLGDVGRCLVYFPGVFGLAIDGQV